MAELEVRQLRYFVAVAEELHFGRAAERLGMTQPPLSRALRDLERQLGVALLERTTRRVALTPAGEVLLHDARAALDAVSAAARRAREAGRTAPVLRLALKADHDGGLLGEILAGYRREAGGPAVELVLGTVGEQAAAVRAGHADVALLVPPFDAEGLDTEPLTTEPRLVALADRDPLARRTDLWLDDLAGRVLPDGSPAPEGCTGPLRPGHPRLDAAQILTLVEAGQVVWFVPVSLARRHARPGITYRTVEDLRPITVHLAWPAGSRSPVVAAFVRTALAAAAGLPPSGLGNTPEVPTAAPLPH